MSTNEWKDIRKEPPLLCKRILAFSKHHGSHTTAFITESDIGEHITHWMPMPEPPKKKTFEDHLVEKQTEWVMALDKRGATGLVCGAQWAFDLLKRNPELLKDTSK